MQERSCGLDFGTSNSTIGITTRGTPRLVAVEDGKPTLPSAVFFNFEDGTTGFGRHAIAEYVDGAEGRLMRALKSVLGTSLMRDTTLIKGRRLAFTEVIGMFIGHLKARAEAEAGGPLEHVVLGRPVHFVDDDADADAQAQSQLEASARGQGFRHIDFQFEPIAAALDYEQQVTREQLALIVDIGGGTSDFSIVRVSPERARAVDRHQDILANTGVHIGGTDFDRLLSMAHMMPHFGYRSRYANGKELPSRYYFDLSTWQRINGLYTRDILNELRQVHYEAAQPELVERLIGVIEDWQGHSLAGKVEEAKINLTDSPTTTLTLPVTNGTLDLAVTQADLNQAITEAVQRIETTVDKTLAGAGLRATDIEALFLTGGSTQIPLVKHSILRMFPHASVVEGDMFGSVGLGLTLDARRKFGGL